MKITEIMVDLDSTRNDDRPTEAFMDFYRKRTSQELFEIDIITGVNWFFMKHVEDCNSIEELEKIFDVIRKLWTSTLEGKVESGLGALKELEPDIFKRIMEDYSKESKEK